MNHLQDNIDQIECLSLWYQTPNALCDTLDEIT